MALRGRTGTRRRSTIVLIVAMLMVVGVVAAAGAAPPTTKKVAKATGTYEYITITGSWRAASISAHATEPLKGRWTWTAEGTTYRGPVTCLQVSGDDAWLAGPMSDGSGAVFMWVHDGGTPGRAGDTAFTWGTDDGETLADMEALCESMTTSPYGYDAFDVVSGNLNVWDAP
jgi:hypothetical protein